MKNTKTLAPIFAFVLALTLSACGSAPQNSSQSQVSPLPESTIEPSGVIGVDELPENSPENQAYVDKYIEPFSITGLIDYSFSTGNMDELLGTGEYAPLLAIFNAFYNYDYPNRDFKLSDEETDVPQELFEGTLMAHLDLTPEQIRTACAEFYNEENQVYTASFGLGGVGGFYYITDSSMEGNKLTLVYDVYSNDWDDISGHAWMLAQQGTLQMDISEDSYKYISNSVQNAPGIES